MYKSASQHALDLEKYFQERVEHALKKVSINSPQADAFAMRDAITSATFKGTTDSSTSFECALGNSYSSTALREFGLQASLPLVAAALTRLYHAEKLADAAEVLIVLNQTIMIRLRNEKGYNLTSEIVIIDMCSLLRPESASPASSIVATSIQDKSRESGKSLKVECDACDSHPFELMQPVEPEDQPLEAEESWFGNLTVGKVAIAAALVATAALVLFPSRTDLN
jgi:hypothetical protein